MTKTRRAKGLELPPWMYDVVHDQWFQLTKKKLRWRDVPNYGMAC